MVVFSTIMVLVELVFLVICVQMFLLSHLSEIDQESYPGYFHWMTDTVASNFLTCMCPDGCEHNIPFRRDFAGNNVATCCVENAQPFWNISKSKKNTWRFTVETSK
ncbi:Hypothetical predicted protein [Mytilus galloprovincialis]|uniref:Uncharacterized protein n=1 Tax=Mytilus galloprovincialis TaxID=29158 RepID=A0A8B6ELE8_MYTGA|nr:Hypothetical predicted protein [Mytilus galloprovincialis]